MHREMLLDTLAMGFDVVCIGEGEHSFMSFLHRLAEQRRDVEDIRGLAFVTERAPGNDVSFAPGALH